MGQIIYDVIPPGELTGYLRTATPINGTALGQGLSSVLPAQDAPNGDIEYALRNFDAPGLQVANYRAWDTRPRFGKRGGFTTLRGEIPPLGFSMPLTELELKRFAQLRRNLPAEAINAFYDDARICGDAVRVRLELARADLLLDGIVTLSENGLNLTADFGVPGSHFVTPAIAWNTYATAVPIADMQAYLTTYRADNNGQDPAGFLTSEELLNDLAQVTSIRNILSDRGIVPGLATRAEVMQIFQVYGIRPPWFTFEDMLPNLAGSVQRVIPANRVIFLPRAGVLGNVLVGTTPSADMLSNEPKAQLLARDAQGIVCWAEEEIRPASAITTAEAVALPILRDPKSLFVVTAKP